MKKITLCILLFASFIFSQNCHPISDEFKSNVKDDMWERKHVTMLVQNGVECDNGLFYNVYYPAEIISSACFYENWKANEKTTIMNYNGTHGITFSKYDEFGMMISNTEIVKTSKTCEDLYKQFKKEMR
jgi:hypothetical protein